MLGDLALSKYKVLNRLGGGGEGEVFLVQRLSNESSVSSAETEFVLKRKLCLDVDELNEGLQEALAMAKLNSPHVVRYEDIFILAETNKELGALVYTLCIVLEYCSEGDLFSLLRSCQEQQLPLVELVGASTIRSWVRQLCFALETIHKNKVIHRDLKPENVFVSINSSLKIGDFGLARKLTSKMRDRGGTYVYWSPEVLSGEGFNQKADVWSLGLLLFELLTETLLSDPRNMRVFGQDALDASGHWDAAERVCHEIPARFAVLRPIVARMLTVDPVQRLPMTVVTSDPFFTSVMLSSDQFGSTAVSTQRPTTDSIVRLPLSAGGSNIATASVLLTEACAKDPRFQWLRIYSAGAELLSDDDDDAVEPASGAGTASSSAVDFALARPLRSSKPMSGSSESASASGSSGPGPATSGSAGAGVATTTDPLRTSRHEGLLDLNASFADSSLAPIDAGQARLRDVFFPMSVKHVIKALSGAWGLYVDGRLEGVALWFPPDKDKAWPVTFAVKLLWRLKATMSVEAVKSGLALWKSVERTFEAMMPSSNYWYLYICGVHSRCQGRGYGTLLLEPVLQRADEEQIYCACYTFSERSVPFFQRLHFEVVECVHASKELGPYWLLRRKPQAPRNVPAASTASHPIGSSGHLKQLSSSVDEDIPPPPPPAGLAPTNPTIVASEVSSAGLLQVLGDSSAANLSADEGLVYTGRARSGRRHHRSHGHGGDSTAVSDSSPGESLADESPRHRSRSSHASGAVRESPRDSRSPRESRTPRDGRSPRYESPRDLSRNSESLRVESTNRSPRLSPRRTGAAVSTSVEAALSGGRVGAGGSSERKSPRTSSSKPDADSDSQLSANPTTSSPSVTSTSTQKSPRSSASSSASALQKSPRSHSVAALRARVGLGSNSGRRRATLDHKDLELIVSGTETDVSSSAIAPSTVEGYSTLPEAAFLGSRRRSNTLDGDDPAPKVYVTSPVATSKSSRVSSTPKAKSPRRGSYNAEALKKQRPAPENDLKGDTGTGKSENLSSTSSSVASVSSQSSRLTPVLTERLSKALELISDRTSVAEHHGELVNLLTMHLTKQYATVQEILLNLPHAQRAAFKEGVGIIRQLRKEADLSSTSAAAAPATGPSSEEVDSSVPPPPRPKSPAPSRLSSTSSPSLRKSGEVPRVESSEALSPPSSSSQTIAAAPPAQRKSSAMTAQQKIELRLAVLRDAVSKHEQERNDAELAKSKTEIEQLEEKLALISSSQKAPVVNVDIEWF